MFPIIFAKIGNRIRYFIRDKFASAGAVATPGPGTRVDVNTSITIAGGAAVFNAINDILYYDEAITRTAGAILKAELNAAASTDFDVLRFGFDDAKTAAPDRNVIVLAGSNVLQVMTNGTAIQVDSYAGITSLQLIVIPRASGAYYLWHNGTNWRLLYYSSTNNTVTLYAGIGAITTAPTANLTYFALPDYTKHLALNAMAALCYDTFTRADGAPGNSETTGQDGQTTPALAWSGNGTIDTNELKVTPSLGAELVTNGDFSAWTGDDPDGWTVGGESGADPEVSEVGTGEGHGGVGTGMCNFYGTTGFINITQSILMSGAWYNLSILIDTTVVGSIRSTIGGNQLDVYSAPGTFSGTQRAGSATFEIIRNTNPNDVTIDNVSVKQLTLSSTIAAVQPTTLDTFTSVEMTITDLTQAGLMLRLDSVVTPANYLHVYCNRVDNKIYVDEVAAGVVTNKSSTAFTYSATAELIVRLIGTSYYVWYNNTFITSGTTTVAGNTATAVFMTDAASRVSTFLVLPATTAGQANDQFAVLDKY